MLNGNFTGDALISTTFSRKTRSKAIHFKRPGTIRNQQMERTVSTRNFGLPFKKSSFSREIFRSGRQNYISFKISGFFG